MKTILSDLDQVISSLENKGMIKQADKLHNVFMKFAQSQSVLKYPTKVHYVQSRLEGASPQNATEITKIYNITMDQLLKANPGLNLNLKPGNKIIIPDPREPVPSLGEELFGAAKGTIDKTLRSLRKKMNPMFQKLNPSPTPVASGQFPYKVQPFENFDMITRRHREALARTPGAYVGNVQSFQDLVKSMNPNISDFSKLSKNQTLMLPVSTKKP